MFLKTLKSNYFKENTRVRKVDSKLCGTILEVIQDVEKINWSERGVPLFIIVQWDNNVTDYHNPYQLTYKRAR